MLSLLARRALAGGCWVALVLAGLMATPAHATETSGRLTFRSVSVSPTNVDASSGSGKVRLTWSFDDTVAEASNITGSLTLQRSDGTGSYTVPFDFLYGGGSTASGTIRHATFTTDFPVPQYARTATSEYRVTKIAATDDQGQAVTVSGRRLAKAKFTAVQAVDNTAPTYELLQIASWSKSAIYNRDQSGTVTYYINVSDSEAGISNGTLVVKGPDGTTLSAPFAWDPDDYNAPCGPDPQHSVCTVDVTVPANAAAGTWVVDRLNLTDAAGNTRQYADLNAAPLVVSANRQIQASDFVFDPPHVDNWRNSQVTHLKFTLAGAQQGLERAKVALGGPCTPQTDTPVVGDDGAVDIPVTVYSIASSCDVTGITVTDKAGNTSLYGTDFGAPDLGLVVRRTPNTTPPVADSAKLSWTTLPDGTQDQVGNSLTVHTVSHVGVTQFSVTLFDSSGASVGGAGGGVSPDAAENVSIGFTVRRSMAPGTYTVAFSLTDASGLRAAYGYPNTAPPPGGPLTLVIPAS